jgi:arylsulfatase A-like enzyme
MANRTHGEAQQDVTMSSDASGPGGGSVSRRDALIGSGALLATAALAAGEPGPASAQTGERPHIVCIVADDMGWKDVGYHGSDIKTPNLDKLAQSGARLEQHYALPMCTPTRAALMTGRYPLRYGLQTGVIPGAGTYSLPLDEHLLPQLLKDAGYKTVMSGKWHLGHAKIDYWPHRRGFDSFYGCTVGEIDHFTHSSHGVADWFRDDKPIVEEGFDNSLFGREAVRVIKAHDPATPLFLYLAFTAPHTPFQAPKEYLDRYASISDPNRRAYAAMISVIDDEVGNVIAALEERKMRDNTLITFQSDNGGVKSSMFSGDTPVEGGLPADNGPYRDGKGTLYEGGTRVAALANWPGRIKPGTINQMTHIVDWYPTLARLAKAKLGKNKPLDGMDVWSTISTGSPTPRKEVVYNVDPFGGAVRQGDWKLVWKASLPPKIELFNIAQDRSENQDVSRHNPATTARLRSRIVELAGQMAPPLLLKEAVKLTYYTPPNIADPSVLFSIHD